VASLAADPADPQAPWLRQPVPHRVHTSSTWTVLEALEASTFTLDSLREAGLVHHKGFVKVLRPGQLNRAITVEAHAFSASATAAITAAGGSVRVIDLPYGDRRPPVRGNALANR